MGTLDENLDDIEHEVISKKNVQKIIAGVKLAESRGYGFNAFKKYIGMYLNRKMTENQWVFDYEGFVCMIHPEIEINLTEWAKEYYEKDWKKR